MGNFKRIWSEGQATRIYKVTVQREQGLCKVGGGFDKIVYGRTGSKTGVPLIPMVVYCLPGQGSEESYGGISRRSGAGQLPHSNLNVYRRHSDDIPDRGRPKLECGKIS